MKTAEVGKTLTRDDLFQTVFRLAPDALVVCGDDDPCPVLEVNAAFEALTGLSRAESLGRDMRHVMSTWLDPKRWDRAFEALARNRTAVAEGFRIRRKDSTLVEVLVSLSLAQAGGRRCRIVSFREAPPPQRPAPSSDGARDRIQQNEFSSFVDSRSLQELINCFYRITHIGMTITDLHGEVHCAAGWADICTDFHRCHPETLERCNESDAFLGSQVSYLPEKKYCAHRCKNGMWDHFTPIIIDGEHVANLYLPHCFLPDERPTRAEFEAQAERYGFDKEAYLAAFERVPRWTQKMADDAMELYTRLARLIGEMGLARKRLELANSELRKHQENLEELVRERTSSLNQAQEIAHIGSWKWDLRTGAMSWSAEMYRVFGLRPEKPPPASLDLFLSRVHDADRTRVSAAMAQAASSRRPFNLEFRTIPLGGRERAIRLLGDVRCDRNATAIEVFGTNQDATEERDAQRLLAEAKERAEAASRAKSVFLASMSHELRTPLNAVIGFSRLLRESGPTSEQAESLDIINRSGQHLLGLIDNVLDISKIEAGRVVLDQTEFDIFSLVQEVQSLMQVRAQERGLSLTVEQSPELPRVVLVDGGKLRQVLFNLVENAIKYTRQGGVTVRAGLSQRGAISRLRFEVEDTGMGIREEERQRIFLPFVQLGERPPGEAGTGLGLTICKQYIELMGGEIGVESEHRKGSTFHFELPVSVLPFAQVPSERPRGRVLRLEDGQPRYRLLLVEDQRDNRLLLRKMLEPIGFELCEAVDGCEAVELFETFRPHLVWMDIRMPRMDGKEATRRIRATAAGAAVKIVALTAHALEEERSEILQAGCDEVVRKPFRPEEIFDCIARHLGARYVREHPARAASSEVGISVQALAQVPRTLRQELAEAVVDLDGEQLAAVAARVADYDESLGKAIALQASGLAFTSIQQALKSAESVSIEAP